MMKVIAYLSIMILITSCRFSEESMKFLPFEEERMLTAEKKYMENVTAPDYILVKNNFLFVASSRSDSMLCQYSLPDMKLVRQEGIKGGGENDFALFPMFCRSFTNDVCIWGYTPLTIKRFSVEKEGELTLQKKYTLPYYESFNQMHLLHDSILVYNAIPNDFAIKKLNLNQGKETGKIEFETEGHRETYFYKERGVMSANEQYIVYTYFYKKQIDIYDAKTMKLYKSLKDGDEEPFIRVGDFEGNDHYYVNVVAGEKQFYALCREKDSYVLEVFDYKARPMVKYKFDVVPFLFDIDEEQQVLYGYNEGWEDYFLKYDLSI